MLKRVTNTEEPNIDLIDKHLSESVQVFAHCELARRSFWEYCQLRYPTFYKDDRKYLKEFCDTLQSFYENDLINPNTGKPYTKLLLNAPPRHGKTLTLTSFVEWVLGREENERFICGSYNESLSVRFGKKIRDSIQEEKYSNNAEMSLGRDVLKSIVYSDIFKNTAVKKGDASAHAWALKGQYFNFLSTSPGGTLTGVGCSIGILDDLVKNKEEAYSDLHLDKTWDWYVDTFLSRLEEGAKQIVLMTRWSKKDVCGRLLSMVESKDWYHMSYRAYDSTRKPKMLCKEVLSKASYNDKKLYTSVEIIQANYNQVPIDIVGALYKNLKTYSTLPTDEHGNSLLTIIKSYTDTADEGKDFLCSIVYGIHDGYAYILDVLYTQAGMEVTEGATAEIHDDNKVNVALVESNNGGRSFARNVERILRKELNNNLTQVTWFHQSKNKRARILSNSAVVMNKILFPIGWEAKLPQFHLALMDYKKEGGNKHDDAPDALTGVAEDISRKENKFG